ncbi:MAG: hypothetical protein ACRERE_05340 [Candidatus Entotheonellia bacterium]
MGVIQGYNGQALVEAKYHVIVPAEAFGNGQEYGHVSPMVDGAKDSLKSIGLPEEYLEGKLLSADSNYPSEAKLQTCAQEKLDAYIPEPYCRQRAPRVATQERHQAPMAEKFTVADVPYDQAHDWYLCPQGKVLKLAARRHTIEHNIYRRYEADAADCGGCLLREPC